MGISTTWHGKSTGRISHNEGKSGFPSGSINIDIGWAICRKQFARTK